jgi:type I restriction enzyme S subunit
MERWMRANALVDSKKLPPDWRVVQINDIASQVTTREKVDPEREYKLAGVRLYGGGIFHRESVRGSQISASHLTQLIAGTLMYNRLFAWRGTFAVVQPAQSELFVSGEFPQFVINSEVALPEFLSLFATTQKTLDVVSARSVGSAAVSRNRFKEEEFLALKIPLPPLATQRKIVKRWRAAKSQFTTALSAVEETERKAEASFLRQLGFEPRGATPQLQRVFVLGWKNVERWGIAFNQQASDGMNLDSGKYPIVELGNVIADLENGWSPQCLNRPAKPDEWGVLKLGAVSFGIFNDGENKALPQHLKPIPALEVKCSEVLISRANIPRLVGACALITATRPRLMLCDKIFRVVFRDDSRLEPAYLAEVMKIPQLRRQIEAACTGTSPTMQNITKPSLLALRLPLPSIDVQRKLSGELMRARAKAAQQRDRAARLRSDTAKEIEQLVLGKKSA